MSSWCWGEVVAKSLNKALEGQSTLKGLREGFMIPLQKPGKPKDPTNQRIITLLNTLRKIFAKIIRGRCEERLEDETGTHRTAHTAQRSMVDHAFLLKMMQAQGELSLEGPSLYALSVDMGKAFDTVRREHLIIIIEKVSGRKSDVKRMTKLHLSDIELTVKMSKGSSRGVFSNTGTPQAD